MRIAAAGLVALVALAAAAASCGEEAPAGPRPLPPPISLGPPPAPSPRARSAPPATPPAPPAAAPSAAPGDSGFPSPAPEKGIRKERFAAPEGWAEEPPAGPMRLLQYRLPRAEGDPRDGEVAIFGMAMGSVEGNIARWRGQFQVVAQGKDEVRELPAGEGRKVTLLDIVGKYANTMGPTPDAAPAEPVETRMLAAIVEIPAGTYYVKALGPPATMARWEASVREFVVASAKR